MQFSVSKTLVYFLIFTVIASAVAYKLVLKGYDTTFDSYASAIQQ